MVRRKAKKPQYIPDERGRMRRRHIDMAGVFYILERFSNPDWPHAKAAVAALVKAGKPQDFAERNAHHKAVMWESHPEFRERMEMLLQHERVGPALDKRAEWEAKVNNLVDRSADASQYAPAMTGMAMLGKANKFIDSDGDKTPSAPAALEITIKTVSSHEVVDAVTVNQNGNGAKELPST